MRRITAYQVCVVIVALAASYAGYALLRRSLMVPPTRQVTRTAVPAPIQVNVYVYRAEDVEKVLSAARKTLPALEGTEGIGR